MCLFFDYQFNIFYTLLLCIPHTITLLYLIPADIFSLTHHLRSPTSALPRSPPLCLFADISSFPSPPPPPPPPSLRLISSPSSPPLSQWPVTTTTTIFEAITHKSWSFSFRLCSFIQICGYAFRLFTYGLIHADYANMRICTFFQIWISYLDHMKWCLRIK